jgi:hypothetical protein
MMAQREGDGDGDDDTPKTSYLNESRYKPFINALAKWKMWKNVFQRIDGLNSLCDRYPPGWKRAAVGFFLFHCGWQMATFNLFRCCSNCGIDFVELGSFFSWHFHEFQLHFVYLFGPILNGKWFIIIVAIK